LAKQLRLIPQQQFYTVRGLYASLHLIPDNHANSVFYRPDALPAAQPTASKH